MTSSVYMYPLSQPEWMLREVEFELISRLCQKRRNFMNIAEQTEQKAKWLQMKQFARWRVPDVGENVCACWHRDKIVRIYMRKEENETAKRSETLSPCCENETHFGPLQCIFLFNDQWRKGEKLSLERTQFMLYISRPRYL